MQSLMATGLLAVSLAGFDVATLLGWAYPDRDKITVQSEDGTPLLYACKREMEGGTAEERAGKARDYLDAESIAYGEKIAMSMMAQLNEDGPLFPMALGMTVSMDAWALAMVGRMEKRFGCILLGETGG